MNNIGLFLSFEEAETDVRRVASSLGWDVIQVHQFANCYSFTLRKVVMFPNTSKCLKRSFELVPGAINPNWKLLLKKALIDQEVEACAPETSAVSAAMNKLTYAIFCYEVCIIANNLGWEVETGCGKDVDGTLYLADFYKTVNGTSLRKGFSFHKNAMNYNWKADIIEQLNTMEDEYTKPARVFIGTRNPYSKLWFDTRMKVLDEICRLPCPFTKDHDDLPDCIRNYIETDVMQIKQMLNSFYGKPKSTLPKIKKVHSNDPVTAVIWDDGTKTLVRVQNGEQFDPEKGLAMAIAKKALGNKGDYYEVFKEHLKNVIKKEQPKVRTLPPIDEVECEIPLCTECKYESCLPTEEPCNKCCGIIFLSGSNVSRFEPKEVTNEN